MMISKLEKIDNKIKKQLDELRGIISRDSFQVLTDFTLTKDGSNIDFDSLKEKIKENKTTKGIYLFQVYKDTNIPFEEWIKDFRKKFMGENDDAFKNQWTSNISTNRYKKHDQAATEEMWVPLYIGKSKAIHKRVQTHIYGTLGRPPFALKLHERNTLNNMKFRVKYVPLPVVTYDNFANFLEKKLRRETKPLAGR